MESGKRLEPYKIIAYGGMGEIEEKKSRFIAHVASAGTEEEALAFIEARKKQYWDARHNCYAYVLGEQAQTGGGCHPVFRRCSAGHRRAGARLHEGGAGGTGGQ